MPSYNELLNQVLALVDEPVTESVAGKVGTVVRKTKDRIHISKDWNVGKSTKHVELKDIPDEKFDEIVSCFTEVRNSDTFSKYKPNFEKLCKLLGIPSEHMVITNYTTEKDKEHNKVTVDYGVSKKKITIPNGSTLYHMSTNKSITALDPAFKGKSAKSYLYSSPRVYFTLVESMPKFAADIKQKETTQKYVCTENIQYAWLDPLVPTYTLGAVYVETNTSIKVEKLEKYLKDNEVKESSTEPVFDDIFEFMEYYGFEFVDDDDVYEEGVKDIAEKIKSTISPSEMKKKWEEDINNIKSKVSKEIEVNFDKYTKIKELYDEMTYETKYSSYKRLFSSFCKEVDLPAKDIVLEKVSFSKESDTMYKIHITYSQGKKRFIIPNGLKLLHVSPITGIKELLPSFKSKVKGRFMYPSKRVYFTIGKEISPNKSGNENKETTKYTPKEDIKTAYIDMTITNFSNGAVFVDTEFPIPVKELNDTVKESVSTTDVKLSIYESCKNEIITKEERDELLRLL